MPAGTDADPLPDSARVEPVRFLQTCFQPTDWIAVFLKNYQNGQVAQRIGPLSWAMSDHVQAWLSWMNGRRFNLLQRQHDRARPALAHPRRHHGDPPRVPRS